MHNNYFTAGTLLTSIVFEYLYDCVTQRDLTAIDSESSMVLQKRLFDCRHCCSLAQRGDSEVMSVDRLLLLIFTVASHKHGIQLQAEWMFNFLENTGPEYSVRRINIIIMRVHSGELRIKPQNKSVYVHSNYY